LTLHFQENELFILYNRLKICFFKKKFGKDFTWFLTKKQIFAPKYSKNGKKCAISKRSADSWEKEQKVPKFF
jgi:hypothetical protein